METHGINVRQKVDMLKKKNGIKATQGVGMSFYVRSLMLRSQSEGTIVIDPETDHSSSLNNNL